MNVLLPLLSLLAPSAAEMQPTCAAELKATATVYRLADLPQEIRDDLKALVQTTIGERNGPLLQTDAPSEKEKAYPTVRFHQALLVKNEWFVQFEP